MSAPSPAPAAAPADWRQRLPNALTVARLALAVAFVATLSLPSVQPGARAILLTATALFIVAAVTDALDGALARRWNATSQFGRVMDPFADKILVLSAYVLLAGPAFRLHTDTGVLQASGVLPWMAAAMLARELLVTSLRGLAEQTGQDFSAGSLGKIKMIAQSVAAPAALLVLAFDAEGRSATILSLVAYAVVGITVLSAWPYIRRAIAPARQETSP